MTNILEQVARKSGEFRPETPQEFFALQLARKLNDAASVRSYVTLAEQYSEDFLLQIYRLTLDEGRNEDMADRFRIKLRRWTGQEES